MHRHKHTQRGASLIEVIGAFVLLAMITAGVIDISHSSVMNAVYAKQQSVAMALAQEEMGKQVEELRLRGNIFAQKPILSSGRNFTISYHVGQIGGTPSAPSCTNPGAVPCPAYEIRLESIVYDYDYTVGKTEYVNKSAKKITVIVNW